MWGVPDQTPTSGDTAPDRDAHVNARIEGSLGSAPDSRQTADAPTAAPAAGAPVRYPPPPDLSRYAWLSVGAAVATILLKGTAAALTGSVGLLSDAAESLVNLVAAVIAVIALKVSIRPPDHNHPFGHSKAEYFSAVIEGVMIFVAAGFIIASAVDRLLHPRMPEQLGLGLVIVVVASVINGAVGLFLRRQGAVHRSATLHADGTHLLTDVVTSVAVIIGVALVAVTGWQVLDPVVAILAGINILWTGWGLIRHAVDGLMDIALPQDVHDRLVAVLDRYREPGVIDMHAVRTRQGGNREFMEFHLLVPGAWPVQHGHDLSEEIIDALVAEVPDIRVSVHLEPIEDLKSYQDQADY